MKTLFTCIIFLALTYTVSAQHELYTSCAYTYAVPINQGGAFFRFDSLGNNMHTIHNFDSLTGAYAQGAVIQATNGKLYGLTCRGGVNNEGTLFEFDPTFDSFRVLMDIPQYDMGSYNLMQASNGKIYYASGSGFQHIMEYDIATNTLTRRSYIPYPKVPTGALTEVSGKLYGITGLGGVSGYGQIFVYNIATQTLSYIYDFVMTSGFYPKSQLVQATDGLLYGTTRYTPAGMGDPRYGLYSFNPATNAYTYKQDIPVAIGAADYITAAPNGKIYGMGTYGTDISGNHFGCIFEYNPATNAIRITHNFGNQSYAPPPTSGYLYTGNLPLGGLKLTSYGKMYGANAHCAFEYDYVTDTVWPRATPIGFQTNTNAWFCELCRKPSYKYFPSDTISRCAGMPYNFTVHSDNAKSFQWKKNGATIPAQTDSVLAFTPLSVFDSGTYTCLMTNQCGITETMTSVRLLVNAGPAVGTITAPASICEGTTAVLSYSVAGSGSWFSSNTAVAIVDPVTGVLSGAGAGTAFISYSASGTCGTTITSVTVSVSPLPLAGVISGPVVVCEGSAIVLSNTAAGGTWSSSNTATATIDNSGVITGIAAGTTVINYAVANGCGAAVATASVTILPQPYAGTIAGSGTLCMGGQQQLSNDATGGMWSSGNTGIATVDASGLVSGITTGNATITYMVTNSCGTAVATWPLVVDPCPTGITNTTANSGITVFPNPTTGACTIAVAAQVPGECSITIINALGQEVYRTQIAVNTAASLNLAIPPGVYTISATTKSNRYNARLVVYNR